jgi:hypothetical protein
MSEDESVVLLREAVRLLRIIARPHIRELEERFRASMLTSEKRRQMWDAMNGSRSLADIGKEVATTAEAVRQFVREVEMNFPDLIEFEREGGGPQRPRRRLI